MMETLFNQFIDHGNNVQAAIAKLNLTFTFGCLNFSPWSGHRYPWSCLSCRKFSVWSCLRLVLSEMSQSIEAAAWVAGLVGSSQRSIWQPVLLIFPLSQTYICYREETLSIIKEISCLMWKLNEPTINRISNYDLSDIYQSTNYMVILYAVVLLPKSGSRLITMSEYFHLYFCFYWKKNLGLPWL